jgi:hypothetical protein
MSTTVTHTKDAPRWMQVAGQALAVLLHPLWIPTYMILTLLTVNPYLFGVGSVKDERSVLLAVSVFTSTGLIPLLAVVMMRMLGMVSSLSLEDRQQRIGPFISTGILYIWVTLSVMKLGALPLAFKIAMLGATIALFLAFFINLFSKISLHAVGMGGWIGMLLVTMAHFSYPSFYLDLPLVGSMLLDMSSLLMFVLLLAGILGTTRLALGAHEPIDLYGGYLVGAAAQWTAILFIQ